MSYLSLPVAVMLRPLSMHLVLRRGLLRDITWVMSLLFQW